MSVYLYVCLYVSVYACVVGLFGNRVVQRSTVVIDDVTSRRQRPETSPQVPGVHPVQLNTQTDRERDRQTERHTDRHNTAAVTCNNVDSNV